MRNYTNTNTRLGTLLERISNYPISPYIVQCNKGKERSQNIIFSPDDHLNENDDDDNYDDDDDWDDDDGDDDDGDDANMQKAIVIRPGARLRVWVTHEWVTSKVKEHARSQW